MRVVVTIPSVEDESAGTSYMVPNLCRSLQAAGAEVSLQTLEKLPPNDWTFPVTAYPRRSFYPLWYLCWSPEMLRGLKAVVRETDIFHVNSIWQMPDVYPSRAARGTSCKVVYCPHGGLSPVAMWRGKTFFKKLMWYFGGQRRALREVAMFHAASEKERDEIRALGFRQPIAVVPNGVDLVARQHRPFATTHRKLVFFGRLHVTKAVDSLVAAWGRVAAAFPDWSLEIAGPDCGARPQLEAMVANQTIPRVRFVGELNGPAKYDFLADADLYVLPSLTENFGITIAEALACGTPAVATKGCPWPELAPRGCGWWTEVGVDALEKTLREALSSAPDVLETMGAAGRRWMAEEYSWPAIGRKMLRSYEWLVRGGERPPWIDMG